MEMLREPPSPPSSTTTTPTDNDYVGISALSTQIESLRVRLTPIIGNSVPSNRDKNVEKKQTRKAPSKIKWIWLVFTLIFMFLASLVNSPSPRRGAINLPISSLQSNADLTR